MQQKPGDIGSAWLVLEGRVPAFKGHFPEAQPPTQGILVLVSLAVVSNQWSCFHNLLAVFGWWRRATRLRQLPSTRIGLQPVKRRLHRVKLAELPPAP